MLGESRDLGKHLPTLDISDSHTPVDRWRSYGRVVEVPGVEVIKTEGGRKSRCDAAQEPKVGEEARGIGDVREENGRLKNL